VSTTNHGPAHHDDDLHRALRDLVDDAALPGPAAHLDVVRGRTRRRRATKKVALGASTLAVAGALGVAAISLPQGVGPEPLAPAESPTLAVTPPAFPTGIDDQDLSCQQPAPTPTGDDLPAHLSIGAPALTAQSGTAVEAPVTMTFAGDASVRVSDQSSAAAYVVVQDGTIVSSALPLPGTKGPITPAPGSTTSWPMSVAPLASCDPAGANDQTPALAPGDYDVYALHRFELDSWAPVQEDGTVGAEAPGTSFDGWLVSEPVPLTVTAPPGPVLPGAFESPTVSFPSPGTPPDVLECQAPMPAPTGDDVLVRMTLDQPRVTVDQGATITLGRTLAAVPHARVEYRDFTGDTGWAIAQDGLVVTYSLNTRDGSNLVTLDERSAQPETLTIRPFTCGSGGLPPYSGEVLPAGEYELYAVETYRLVRYSVQLQDGTWGATNEADLTKAPYGFLDQLVVSEPIPLTVR
jgi:hypothetical protein